MESCALECWSGEERPSFNNIWSCRVEVDNKSIKKLTSYVLYGSMVAGMYIHTYHHVVMNHLEVKRTLTICKVPCIVPRMSRASVLKVPYLKLVCNPIFESVFLFSCFLLPSFNIFLFQLLLIFVHLQSTRVSHVYISVQVSIYIALVNIDSSLLILILIILLCASVRVTSGLATKVR